MITKDKYIRNIEYIYWNPKYLNISISQNQSEAILDDKFYSNYYPYPLGQMESFFTINLDKYNCNLFFGGVRTMIFDFEILVSQSNCDTVTSNKSLLDAINTFKHNLIVCDESIDYKITSYKNDIIRCQSRIKELSIYKLLSKEINKECDEIIKEIKYGNLNKLIHY